MSCISNKNFQIPWYNERIARSTEKVRGKPRCSRGQPLFVLRGYHRDELAGLRGCWPRNQRLEKRGVGEGIRSGKDRPPQKSIEKPDCM